MLIVTKSIDPSFNIQDAEFNDITLKLGSYICMSQNKCLNHITVISIIMKNSNIKEAYLSLLGENNIYNAIQTLIKNTPNLYKKIARKTLFK